MAALIGRPVRIILQQLKIKAIEAPGCLDVDRIVFDRLDGRDARERQEKAEMVGEVPVVADPDVVFDKVLGFEGLTIGRQDKPRFPRSRLRARAEFLQLFAYLAWRSDSQMNILVLKDTALNVRVLRSATKKPLYGGRLVIEGFEKSTRKVLCIKWCSGKIRYGFFNLNGVHGVFAYSFDH